MLTVKNYGHKKTCPRSRRKTLKCILNLRIVRVFIGSFRVRTRKADTLTIQQTGSVSEFATMKINF